MPLYTTDALILRTYKLGESDRIVVFLTRDRGKILKSQFAPKVVATVHPSSLLRQPDEESRQREFTLFVKDLRVALKVADE